MNDNDKILTFLGKIQERIEDLGELAFITNNPITNLIADLEEEFNRSVSEIFDDQNISIKHWNNLPR